jgi:tyrosinase
MSSRVRHRRKVWGACALLVLLALALAGCPSGEDKGTETTPTPSPTPPAGTPYTRVEIASFSADQITALRQGITLMQSRPSTDPTSWIYQANIHGVPVAGDNCPASTDPPQPAWSTCQHGSFFFLAWHRMYLYYFERILRAAIQQATGDPSYQFALPYWDYSTHQLPDSFRTPAAPSNPLYVAERRTSCNSPQGSQQCVSDAQGSSTQALTLFPFCNCPAGQPSCDGCVAGLSPDETFGGEFTPQPEHFLGQFGELELQPHNVIHNRVGGPTGWMSDPDCAARDPIFWLHHANIDRLWQVWLNQNAGRANPLGSQEWTTQTFTFFDADGSQVQKTGCEILDMITQLDYQYQGLPVQNVQLCAQAQAAATPAATPSATPTPVAGAQPPAGPVQMLAASAPSGFTLGNDPVKVAVPIKANQRERVTALSAVDKPEQLRLVVEGLSLVGKGGVFEVYLNLPAGQTPDPKSPSFIGHLALFGHTGHGEESSRSFDVTDEVRELKQRGEWKDQAELTFVLSGRDEVQALGAAAPSQSIKFKRVSLITRQR